MDSFEYAMGLVAIVIGLAIGDLAMSLHKLLRHRATVAWDARVLLTGAYTFLMLFGMWFETWSIHRRPEILNYLFLLSLVVELALLFLMATMALPDEPAADIDLGNFYEASARSIWTVFLLFQISYVAHWLYFAISHPRFTLGALFMALPFTLIPLIGAALMVRWPTNRRLHLITVSILLAWHVFAFWDNRIAS